MILIFVLSVCAVLACFVAVYYWRESEIMRAELNNQRIRNTQLILILAGIGINALVKKVAAKRKRESESARV